MNYCIVVSTDYGFLQEVENSLRLVLDPWKLLEAISYQHGEELLTELPIQMVLVDEKSMPTSPISFYKSTLERYPNTWFINVGTGVGYPNHHPKFYADEAALTPAAEYLEKLLVEALRQ